MKLSDINNHIIKLVNANKKGVDIATILDYLDYINKVRYDKDEVEEILNVLIVDNKIILNNNLYYPS
jgi:DNA replicative helicase MCM subunit Mcm2 (Cdc46/Mcm family)